MSEERDVFRRIEFPDLSGDPFDIRAAADVHDVDQRIRLPQVIQEFVSQTFALPGVGDQTCYVEEVDGDHPRTVYA